MLQAGIDLGVKGLNKEGVNVGRDLKREDGNDQKTESTTFPKEEAGDFANSLMNAKLDRKDTEKVKDAQRNDTVEEAVKKDETRGPKEKKKLPCAFCDYKTGKTSHMQRHVKGVHKFLELVKSEQTAKVEVDQKVVSKKESSISDVTLSEEVALEENLGSANGSSMKRESKCGDCNLRFSGQKHLRRHFLSLHTDKRYSCEECNFTTNRKDTLNTHRNTRGHKMQVFLHDESLLV